MKTVVIVVVDQLSWSDRGSLPLLTAALGGAQLLNLTYRPTVTETAHATIATRLYPESHGIIASATFLEDARGRLEIVPLSSASLMRAGRSTSKITEMRRADELKCFVVSGKDKVARLLDPWGEPDTFYLRKLPGPGDRYEYVNDGGDILPGDLPPTPWVRKDDSGVEVLFAAASLFLERTRHDETSRLLFLALPRLDDVGHYFERSSPEFRRAIDHLDKSLSRFLKEHNLLERKSCEVIVTSDHGYREVSTLLVPWMASNSVRVWKVRPELELEAELPVPPGLGQYDDVDDNRRLVKRPAMLFDGGFARFWTKPKEREAVCEFLQTEWGGYLSDICLGTSIPAPNSHAHWGDVVTFAAPNVCLAKPEWVFKESPVIPERIAGEHGTFEDQDILVPWWSLQGRAPNPVGILDEARSFLLEGQ